MFAIKVERVLVPTWILFRHVGLKITFLDGREVVYANTPGRGVVRQTVAEFAQGRVLTVEVEAAPAKLGIAQIWNRAEQALGTPYRLHDCNCEHFVSWALGRPSESPQLRFVGFALAAGFLYSGMAGR
jgi:hypothetical protein